MMNELFGSLSLYPPPPPPSFLPQRRRRRRRRRSGMVWYGMVVLLELPMTLMKLLTILIQIHIQIHILTLHFSFQSKEFVHSFIQAFKQASKQVISLGQRIGIGLRNDLINHLLFSSFLYSTYQTNKQTTQFNSSIHSFIIHLEIMKPTIPIQWIPNGYPMDKDCQPSQSALIVQPPRSRCFGLILLSLGFDYSDTYSLLLNLWIWKRRRCPSLGLHQ